VLALGQAIADISAILELHFLAKRTEQPDVTVMQSEEGGHTGGFSCEHRSSLRVGFEP
jgi:hypothetical protein